MEVLALCAEGGRPLTQAQAQQWRLITASHNLLSSIATGSSPPPDGGRTRVADQVGHPSPTTNGQGFSDSLSWRGKSCSCRVAPSSESLKEPRYLEASEPRSLISAPRGGMTRIAPGLHHRDLHPRLTEPLGGNLRQRRPDPSALLPRLNREHPDLTDTGLMVLPGGDEPGDHPLDLGHPDPHRAELAPGQAVVGKSLTHGASLVIVPIAVQASTELAAQNILKGSKHWRPSAQRQRDHRFQILGSVRTDADSHPPILACGASPVPPTYWCAAA